MKTKIFTALIAAILVFANSLSAEASRVITDEDGNKVTIPDKIERVAVVGILPLPSVMTVFLGSAEKLVGIPPASMGAAKAGLLGELFPEILKAKTDYTAGLDLNIEELMKLRPDVVFCHTNYEEMKKKLKNAGIPAVAFSSTKWDYDVLRTYDEWIDTLSQIFPEAAKSKEVSAYSKEVYDLIQKKVKDIKPEKRKKVLFIFQYDDKRIITSGRNFFGQYWCDAVGAVNAAEEIKADNSNALITMEQVYKWNPDVIFITNFTPALPEDLYKNKIGGDDWSLVKAVKNKAVYKMPLGVYRSYTPGADTPVTLLWIAQKVYPDLFKDVDIKKDVRDYYKKLYGITLTEKQIDRMYNQGRDSSAGFIQ